MARQEIALQNVDPIPVDAAPNLVTFTTADTVNFDQCDFVDGLVIIAHNADASLSAGARIESVADEDNRVRDQDTQVQIGEFVVFGPFVKDGWRQPGGKVFMKRSSGGGELEFACINPRRA